MLLLLLPPTITTKHTSRIGVALKVKLKVTQKNTYKWFTFLKALEISRPKTGQIGQENLC